MSSLPTAHLLVLIHGINGEGSHLKELERVILSKPNESDAPPLHVLIARTNSSNSTYDGIDWGGERVAQEVVDEVALLQEAGTTVTKVSITGFSLGGLIGRYVIGILYHRGFFDAVAPVNFNTFATPHLGLPKYETIASAVTTTFGPRLLSRTGEQLFCVDKWGKRDRRLLEVMADPRNVFYKGLALFQHLRIYSNAVEDQAVPYVTASISTSDPFANYLTSGVEGHFSTDYEPLIEDYTLPSTPPPPPRFFTKKWLETHDPAHLLPPFLKFGFPMNVLVYMSLPILLPVGVPIGVAAFSATALSSRRRIQLLEKDAPAKEQLIHVLAQLEDEEESDLVPSSSSLPPSTSTPPPQSEGSASPRLSGQPVLSPVQERMAASLNQLAFHKEIAYILGVRSAHTAIVCQNMKIADDRRGAGVVRHWADTFVV